MKKTVKFCSIFLLAAVISLVCVLLATGKAPAAAPALRAKNAADGVVISWDAVKGAENYEVYKLNADKKWEKRDTTKETTFTDKKVKNGAVYSYKVRAVLKKGKVEYGKIDYTFLRSPALKSITNTKSGIKLKWKNSSYAKNYAIYRKTSGGSYKLIATVKGAVHEYTDKTAKNGTKYTYSVASQSGNCKSKVGKNKLTTTFVSQVKNLSVKNSPNGVTLKWSKVNKAVGYVVYRKTAGSSKWVKAATVKSGQTYIDKKTAYGKKNYYKVYAYIKGGTHGVSSSSASVYSVNPKKKMVALTYDDGPYRPVTNQILDTLQKYNARATFFVVGSRLSTYKDCLERENKLGCEIACHTYNHTILTSVSESTIKKEISDTNSLVKKYSGQSVKLVRAPGGAVNDKVKNAVAYPLINWSVDTLDWQNRNTQKTFDNFKNNVKDGSIVLMHDLYTSTGNAAEKIIPWLDKNGYQMVTISEMMDAKGIKIEKGKLYTHG